MVVKILFIILGFFLFLYFFWSRLKEDYIRNQIFSTGLYILMGIVAGNIISSNFFREWDIWSGIMGAFLGAAAGILRFHLRFFEVMEATVFGGLFLFALYFLTNFIVNGELFGIVSFLIVIALIAGFKFLDRHYKTFTWYRSGRVGFTGLAIAGLFFLIFAFIAVGFSGMIVLSGRNDAIISGLLAFISFMALYNLSRKPS